MLLAMLVEFNGQRVTFPTVLALIRFFAGVLAHVDCKFPGFDELLAADGAFVRH